MFNIFGRLQWWKKTRGMSKGEKIIFAQMELREFVLQLKEEFKNEPQSREMIEAFKQIDAVVLDMCGEDQCSKET